MYSQLKKTKTTTKRMMNSIDERFVDSLSFFSVFFGLLCPFICSGSPFFCWCTKRIALLIQAPADPWAGNHTSPFSCTSRHFPGTRFGLTESDFTTKESDPVWWRNEKTIPLHACENYFPKPEHVPAGICSKNFETFFTYNHFSQKDSAGAEIVREIERNFPDSGSTGYPLHAVKPSKTRASRNPCFTDPDHPQSGPDTGSDSPFFRNGALYEPGLGSADPLSGTKLLEDFTKQGVRMRICPHRRWIRKTVIAASGWHSFSAITCQPMEGPDRPSLLSYIDPKEPGQILRRRIRSGTPGNAITILHFAITILVVDRKPGKRGL